MPTNGEKERIKRLTAELIPGRLRRVMPTMPQFEAIATFSVLLATQDLANVPVSDFGMMADVFGQMVSHRPLSRVRFSPRP